MQNHNESQKLEKQIKMLKEKVRKKCDFYIVC
jgi:hypothetical protein